jgi:hypothetical protein
MDVTLRDGILRLAAVLGGFTAAACGSRSAQIEIAPSGTGRFVPFVAHNVVAGYQLDVAISIRETQGVDVLLSLVSVGAIDLGTRQAFLTHTLVGNELQERGLQGLGGRGIIRFRPSLGLVADPPQGPVELTLAAEGADAHGGAVSDFQVVTIEVEPARPPGLGEQVPGGLGGAGGDRE